MLILLVNFFIHVGWVAVRYNLKSMCRAWSLITVGLL
jgi:hypothetical protein